MDAWLLSRIHLYKIKEPFILFFFKKKVKKKDPFNIFTSPRMSCPWMTIPRLMDGLKCAEKQRLGCSQLKRRTKQKREREGSRSLPWEAVAGDWMEAVIGPIRLTNLGTMVCAWAQTMVLHQPPVSAELDRLPLESAVSSTGAAV